jgi:TetR/AcrR family transcriptional regulator, transcriptional repressor for nem operon
MGRIALMSKKAEMNKGKITRERILGKAAALFNSRGYYGASMSDLMQATGMEKGGIYNHFESKELLALQAFDHAVQTNFEIIMSRVDNTEGPVNKLLELTDAFADVVENSPITGGCPLLNSAVESDDAHPVLRERVKVAMAELREYVERLIDDAVNSGEISLDMPSSDFAIIVISALEGGGMLSRLYGDYAQLQLICTHVKSLVRSRAKV